MNFMKLFVISYMKKENISESNSLNLTLSKDISYSEVTGT